MLKKTLLSLVLITAIDLKSVNFDFRLKTINYKPVYALARLDYSTRLLSFVTRDGRITAENCWVQQSSNSADTENRVLTGFSLYGISRLETRGKYSLGTYAYNGLELPLDNITTKQSRFFDLATGFTLLKFTNHTLGQSRYRDYRGNWHQLDLAEDTLEQSLKNVDRQLMIDKLGDAMIVYAKPIDTNYGKIHMIFNPELRFAWIKAALSVERGKQASEHRYQSYNLTTGYFFSKTGKIHYDSLKRRVSMHDHVALAGARPNVWVGWTKQPNIAVFNYLSNGEFVGRLVERKALSTRRRLVNDDITKSKYDFYNANERSLIPAFVNHTTQECVFRSSDASKCHQFSYASLNRSLKNEQGLWVIDKDGNDLRISKAHMDIEGTQVHRVIAVRLAGKREELR